MADKKRSTDRTEIRHLYKSEPQRKGWKPFEMDLVNTTRKLNERQRLDVLMFAQRLALVRINARIAR